MSSRSPEYEEEVVRTLRLVRGLIYGAMAVVGGFLLLLLLGVVLSLSIGSRSSGSSGPAERIGQDVHATFQPGASLSNRSGSGQLSKVTILTAERAGEGLTVTARVTGMDATAALPETWKVYFTDNTQQTMQTEVLGTTKDGTTIRATLEVPAGKSLQFLHVDPDASHGDMYFDIPPG